MTTEHPPLTEQQIEELEGEAKHLAEARGADWYMPVEVFVILSLLAERERLREAVRKRIEAGHNADCDHLLSEEYFCSCGLAHLRTALGEASDGE